MPKKATATVEKTESENTLNGSLELRSDGDILVKFDKNDEFKKAFDTWRGKGPDGQLIDKNLRPVAVRLSVEEGGWIVPVQYYLGVEGASYPSLKEFLEPYNFDTSGIPETPITRRIGRYTNGDYFFKFPFNRDINGQLKSDVPRAHLDGQNYVWTAPESSEDAINQFAEDEDFTFIDHVLPFTEDDEDI